MSASKPIAIVAGALASKAGNGGHAWSRISLVLGLRRLGFEVVFVEQLADAGRPEREYFERVCGQFHVDGYLLTGQPPYELVARAEAAMILLNVGGHLTFKEMTRAPRVKVYLDDDPGYTQLWRQSRLLADRLEGYDFHFTFGANIGRPGCALPVDGIEWRHLRPPVVLEQWPVANACHDGFRTVASWRGGYGRVEVDGHLYGQKAHEFRRFVQVPERIDRPFEIALDIHAADAADADLLCGHGWCLVDPAVVAASPDDFRHYVQGAGAEFSVAQGIYVETQCGWFSDRSTRFLASGKPALIQDTGFSRSLRTGEGLLAFSTLEGAVVGAKSIQGDYEAHSQAARAIAEEYFDSDKVLGRMLEEVGV
jgi:hypothetical protein